MSPGCAIVESVIQGKFMGNGDVVRVEEQWRHQKWMSDRSSKAKLLCFKALPVGFEPLVVGCVLPTKQPA